MIIRSLLLLTKHHRSSRPISSESTRFDTSKLDVPLWLNFARDCFCEALDSPFGGTVDAEGGNADLAANGGDLLDAAASGLIDFAHDFEGFAGHMEEAEEVDL